MIGERVKHVFTGYKVWILSYKDECFDKIGLKPSEKMKLMTDRWNANTVVTIYSKEKSKTIRKH